MKIHLYMQGACGNQFFQYAFVRTIQEQIGGELILNYHHIKGSKNIWPGSDNLLKDFNVTPYTYESKLGFGGVVFKIIRAIRIVLGLKDFNPRTYRAMVKCADFLSSLGIYYFDAAYYPFKIQRRKNIYVHGYFESPRYFKSIDRQICNELKPTLEMSGPCLELYNRIISSNAVCITIKRQDIENKKISDIYTYSAEYFYKGIEIVKERVECPVFFIFADDINWCRENIKIDGEVYFENEGNTIPEKIKLMSSCKHYIIHNSTFSWWVQHLSRSEDKIVIAPSKWMNRNDQPIDIYEEGWIYLTDKGEITSSHE